MTLAAVMRCIAPTVLQFLFSSIVIRALAKSMQSGAQQLELHLNTIRIMLYDTQPTPNQRNGKI